MGHDRAAAAAWRGQGYATVAALSAADAAAALRCTHVLRGAEVVPVEQPAGEAPVSAAVIPSTSAANAPGPHAAMPLKENS